MITTNILSVLLFQFSWQNSLTKNNYDKVSPVC